MTRKNIVSPKQTIVRYPIILFSGILLLAVILAIKIPGNLLSGNLAPQQYTTKDTPPIENSQTPILESASGKSETLTKSSNISAPICNPVKKWEWIGDTEDSTAPEPWSTPLTAHFFDENGDSNIDACDTSDVVFLNKRGFGPPHLTLLNGRTGVPIITMGAAGNLSGTSSVGIADIDDNGVPEIVTMKSNRKQLIAFNRDGTTYWESASTSKLMADGPIGFADLNQDGKTEIYIGNFVFNSDGSLRWEGTKGIGTINGISAISNAVDLLPNNPGLELLAGNTLYDSNGSVLWNNNALPDGWTGIADFTGDGIPEIILVFLNEAYLLSNNGTVIGTPYKPLTSGGLAQPVIADVDGDGKPEFIAVNGETIKALAWQANSFVEKWSTVISDPSGIAAATAFDFNDDGAYEIVYHDMLNIHLIDGLSGTILWSDPLESGTLIESPIVTDLDANRKPDIIVNGAWSPPLMPQPTNRVVAYECTLPSTTPRSVWNQYQYHVENVTDAAKIPQFENKTWTASNTWHAQVKGTPKSCGVLSVHWGALNAVCSENSIMVNWETLMETDTIGFYVERAIDQKGPFTTVSPFIFAKGGFGSNAYSWLDEKPIPSVFNWYRIREVCSAGTCDTSDAFTTEQICAATPIVCGGVANIPCPDGMTCQVPRGGTESDPMGVCVPGEIPR